MSINASLDSEVLNGLKTNDLDAVETWLRQNPGVLPKLGVNTQPSVLNALQVVQSPEMAALLVDRGLDLVAVSDAWRDGFGLHCVRSLGVCVKRRISWLCAQKKFGSERSTSVSAWHSMAK